MSEKEKSSHVFLFFIIFSFSDNRNDRRLLQNADFGVFEQKDLLPVVIKGNPRLEVSRRKSAALPSCQVPTTAQNQHQERLEKKKQSGKSSLPSSLKAAS